MQQNRPFSLRWIVIGLAVIVLVAWRVSVAVIGSKLEIGPETTFVTGPRSPDGLIDYMAALHLLLSEEVKPEDNAAILIDQAFGPGAIPPELRARYFEWMKTAPLPEQGNYVLTHSALMAQKLKAATDAGELSKAMDKEFVTARSRPWNPSECPLAAEWLETNAVPLDLIEQATKQSQYYSPLVSVLGMRDAVCSIQNLREAARLLSARAMLRLGSNDIAGAWSDLLACHRLAQLASQRPVNLTQFHVAMALESAAASGDAALLAHGLTAEQARNCLAEHGRLQSVPLPLDAINRGERLVSLDITIRELWQTVDVNQMLRRTNQVTDEAIAALNLAQSADRRQALTALETELNRRSAAANRPLLIIVNLATGSRRIVTESIGNKLLAISIPTCQSAENSQTRSCIRRDLVQIGFALAAFHADRGTYPRALNDLVPKYLNTIPTDRFNDKPLLYTPQENGYLIYSIGANGRDDGGVVHGPNKEDDVSFEVPPKIDE